MPKTKESETAEKLKRKKIALFKGNTDLKQHSALTKLAFSPISDEYKLEKDLKPNMDGELFDRLNRIDTYGDTGIGEIVMNYDVQYKKQLDKIKELKQLNGEMMDEKDIRILKSDLEKSFTAGLTVVAEDLADKIAKLNNKISTLDVQAKQTCKDGNCTITAIKELKEGIVNSNELNENKITSLENTVSKINEDTTNSNNTTTKAIENITEKMETICTGVDCLTKALEDEENTVTCPSCGGKFIWNNQSHCPHCNVQLEVAN